MPVVEVEKFKEIVTTAWDSGRVVVNCQGPGAARRTRQKFYRLRAALPDSMVKTWADGLSFELNGCQIFVTRPAWTVGEGVENADAKEEPELASGDRLDNPQ